MLRFRFINLRYKTLIIKSKRCPEISGIVRISSKNHKSLSVMSGFIGNVSAVGYNQKCSKVFITNYPQ